jgi:hypothetical protein
MFLKPTSSMIPENEEKNDDVEEPWKELIMTFDPSVDDPEPKTMWVGKEEETFKNLILEKHRNIKQLKSKF